MSLLEMQRVSRSYQGLRPLRVASLVVKEGDVLTIGGIDASAAETFVHLVTGAALPEEGDVTLFGQNTREIGDSETWLKTLDGLGMITARGVLIGAFSVLQNIAMSFTLDVDPVDPRVVPQVGALAREVGIAAEALDVPAAAVGADVQMRVHLARALALAPKLLIAEHPSAGLPRDGVSAFGSDLARSAQARGMALLAITADDLLARAIGGQRLELHGATGDLRAPGLFARLFPPTRSRSSS